jgi:hypothetical protein
MIIVCTGANSDSICSCIASCAQKCHTWYTRLLAGWSDFMLRGLEEKHVDTDWVSLSRDCVFLVVTYFEVVCLRRFGGTIRISI